MANLNNLPERAVVDARNGEELIKGSILIYVMGDSFDEKKWHQKYIKNYQKLLLKKILKHL